MFRLKEKVMSLQHISISIFATKIASNEIYARYFCLTPNLLKTFQECQHYEDARSSKVI